MMHMFGLIVHIVFLVRVEKKTKKRELKNTISKRNDIRIRFERRIKWASKTNEEAHNVDHEAKSK
jgi:hypothetical protein